MTDQDFGAVTALEFRVSPKQGFEDIVEEFDIAFRPLGTTRRSLIWDGNDIAMVERDAIRVILGWLPAETPETPAFLIVAVGQSPNDRGVEVDGQTCAMINQMVRDHVESYLPICNVLRADVAGPVNADVIDTLADMLRRDYQPDRSEEQTRIKTSPWAHDGTETDRVYGHYSKQSPFLQTETQDEVMDAQYRELAAQAPISLPQRLTIYTLGATMLLYTPPLGATLLVYSTLRDLTPTQPASLAA